MAGFVRSSSSLVVVALALAGCVEELPPIEGTTSIAVELEAPADPGAFDDRLPDDARSVTMSLRAIDAQNQLDADFSGTLDVYAHYLGGLTPELGEPPLATVQMTGGVANLDLELPAVFGPTYLWVEHTSGDAPTYATGTSALMWYRDPFLVDVQRPPDEGALDAFERSPLEKKQVNITASRYGDAGRMVVTGIYAQGYTLSDVQCADAAGTPPCVADDYDHMFVFSFSRPEDEDGNAMLTGQVVERLAGAVSEFNGLTEVNFPQSFLAGTEVREELVPEPVVIEPSWLDTRIELERVEAALVAMEDATLCPLDEDFETYAQWKLDIGRGCGRPINIISKGQVADFDPTEYVGEVIPRVVGTLRPVNIGSFHVWIVYPRTMADLTLP
jgi:hypothetical protein